MGHSPLVESIGAACFGVVTGYVTYRTLARSTASPQVSDIAAVVAAIGGGAVTALFPQRDSDAFGWYAIGLPIGMAVYLLLFRLLHDRSDTATVLTRDDDITPR